MQTRARAEQDRTRPARRFNDAIDRALQQPTETSYQAVLRLRTPTTAQALAERVRHRAALLARRERQRRAPIVQARDRLMLAIYAAATPVGWHSAWCDGSIVSGSDATGIGGLLMDPRGRIVAEIARRDSGLTPFEAEIAALVAMVEVAHAQGAKRLRVYSDCGAVVRLWHQRRGDPRLAAFAARVRELRRLEICALPRLHNQPAHRLAKAGAGHAGV